MIDGSVLQSAQRCFEKKSRVVVKMVVISDCFIRCVNDCFEKGEMSHSQKLAFITLIEKKGKDRSLIENWRPISLLNVDAKIMSKVIATRLKKRVASYHSSQSNRVYKRSFYR